MPYLKIFMLSITLFFLSISSEITFASSVEGECGGINFEIKVIENQDESESLYTLYYKTNSKEKKFLYTPESEHLSLACVQDQAKRNFLLLEERCGGSGCTDQGTYTLIDPNTKKILVEYNPMELPYRNESKSEELNRRFAHEKKNHDQVAMIIGYEPPYLPLGKDKYAMLINLSASPRSGHIKIKTYGAARQK